jgi:hypothetical protein
MSPLQQPFHIFRKDARHLWPETLVSIALLIAFAWAIVQTLQPSDGSFNPASLALLVLRLFIPISWLVLISRLVHDEELVGDRQFWTTRPYTWYSLLVAKLLYIIVFIGIPFLLMQAWLLHHEGLYPTLLIPELLKNFLFIAVIFLLPLFVIAVVTATFPRYISSALGGFIYVFVVLAFAAYKWPESFVAPYLPQILAVLALAIIFAAIIVQYARRKTLIARLLLVSVPIVIAIFALLAPVNALTSHRYPDTAIGTASFFEDPMHQDTSGRLFVFQNKINLNLPVMVQLNGVDDKTFIEAQRYRLTLDGPNGVHYTSDWSSERATFTTAQKLYLLPLRLPEKIFNQVHNQPVALHLELGTQAFHAGTPYSVSATETPFPIPGHAACLTSDQQGSLECRFPFANPGYMQVAATVHSGDCFTPGPQSAPAYGGLAPSNIPFGFSPIEVTRAQLTVQGSTRVPLCPGTRTTFTPTVPGTYARLHLDIPTITLDPYAGRIQPRPTTPDTDSPQPQTN